MPQNDAKEEVTESICICGQSVYDEESNDEVGYSQLEKDIEVVMQQAGVNRQQTAKALVNNKRDDVVSAIIELFPRTYHSENLG